MTNMPTEDIVALLRKEPRTAKLAHQVHDLHVAGDVIQVNEGDYIMLRIAAMAAADLLALEPSVENPVDPARQPT